MRKFEYKFVKLDVQAARESPGESLKYYGQTGWELVGVVPASIPPDGNSVWLFFKREIEE